MFRSLSLGLQVQAGHWSHSHSLTGCPFEETHEYVTVCWNGNLPPRVSSIGCLLWKVQLLTRGLRTLANNKTRMQVIITNTTVQNIDTAMKIAFVAALGFDGSSVTVVRASGVVAGKSREVGVLGAVLRIMKQLRLQWNVEASLLPGQLGSVLVSDQ